MGILGETGTKRASDERLDLVSRAEDFLADLDLAGEGLAAAHMGRVLDALNNR